MAGHAGGCYAQAPADVSSMLAAAVDAPNPPMHVSNTHHAYASGRLALGSVLPSDEWAAARQRPPAKLPGVRHMGASQPALAALLPTPSRPYASSPLAAQLVAAQLGAEAATADSTHSPSSWSPVPKLGPILRPAVLGETTDADDRATVAPSMGPSSADLSSEYVARMMLGECALASTVPERAHPRMLIAVRHTTLHFRRACAGRCLQ